MGDCYSVVLAVRLRPKHTKSNLQQILRTWMRDCSCNINWSLQLNRKSGIRPDSFVGICKILLAFHQGNCKHYVDEAGFEVYRSGFNASYGWNSVMIDAFKKIAWALDEGSFLEIYRDEGHSTYKIRIDNKESRVWENHEYQ